MDKVVVSDDIKYENLLKQMEERIDLGVAEAAKSVVKNQLSTYWDMGKFIVEFEQEGKINAEYGLELLKKLARDLTLRKGRGYSRPNLYNMRKFYLTYPNGISELAGLTWSHFCELMRIDNELERHFYEKECLAQKWNVRTLRKQKERALFLRIASEKDKEGVLALANEGIIVEKPADAIRDTYTLDFLNVESERLKDEKDLEKRIIRNLETFLLELGKGFTFVKEQYPMKVNNKTYKCDLVFYHRILKCFFLIDLKIGAVEHKDIGQMNMYMGYFAEEVNEPDDNPPIGMVLAREKDELLVKYATYGMDSNLFVSKYELYLPNEEELKQLVNNIIIDSENAAENDDAE